MSTAVAKFPLGAKKVQLGVSALAVAASATITPVVVPVISHAAPGAASAASSGLIWGYEALPAAAVVTGDNKAVSNAVTAGEPYTPQQLIGFAVQGVAQAVDGIAAAVQATLDATVVIVGTTVFVAVAGVGTGLALVGDFLPGPLGDFFTNAGSAVTSVANQIAEAINVGPYSTSS